MVFNWKWLIVAVLIFAAIASSSRAYGKWIFALIMVGILLAFSGKLGNALK